MSEIDKIVQKYGPAVENTHWPRPILRAALLEYGAIKEKEVREENKRLIADDAFCIQFQTIGQYRKALLDAHQG